MKRCFLVILFALHFVLTVNAQSVKDYIEGTKEKAEYKDKSFYPSVRFDIKSEAFFDSLSHSEGKKESAKPLYLKSNLLLDINFNRYFTIHTDFALEKIKGSSFRASTLNLMKDEGILYGTSLTTKELALQFNVERAKISVGKIAPRFLAGNERWSEFFYDTWYGVSGTFFNEAYILEEKLGVKINVLLVENAVSKVNFEASAFTNDNTNLFKKPLFEKRQISNFLVPEAERRYAGDANNLKSHSLSIWGFLGLSKRDVLSFALAYKEQLSDNGRQAERGYGATLQYTRTFFEDFTISVFGEYARIRNAYAVDKFSERFITGSVSTSFAGFSVGYLMTHYRSSVASLDKKVKFSEYFLGFEVPKTNFGVFIARKSYNLPNDDEISGFGLNLRYRII